MFNLNTHICCVLMILFVLQSAVFSQTPDVGSDSKAEWLRVQSDNGEFSIEIPAKYVFYRNKDGFFDAKDSTNFHLKSMNMLNAYESGTLLSFETYEAGKAALDSIYDRDSDGPEDLGKSAFERNGVKVKQLIQKSNKVHVVRQYFSSKTHIYILTAASRIGETQQMRRFLDSAILTIDVKESAAESYLRLKDLPITDVTVEMQPDSKPFVYDPKAVTPIPPKDDTVLPLAVINKPRPSYVDVARMKAVTGTIRVRLTFAKDGFVSKIVVLKSLPEGLLRQSLFAALRIKFLPKMKDGSPETVIKMVEYKFDIY